MNSGKKKQPPSDAAKTHAGTTTQKQSSKPNQTTTSPPAAKGKCINLANDDDSNSSDEEDDDDAGPSTDEDAEDPDGDDEEAKDETDDSDDENEPPRFDLITPNKRRDRAAPLTDQETLELARKKVKMKTLRRETIPAMQGVATRIDHGRLTTAIAQALPNCQQKSSRKWVLQSINGRLTDTPATGNCQPLAMTEALLQTDIALLTHHTEHVELAMQLKFGIYLAYQASHPDDLDNFCAASILDTPEGSPIDMTKEQERHLISEFYRDFATSESDLTTFLPKRLWGRLDTIRMAVKFLGRPIFLIAERGDQQNVHLQIFKLHRSRTGAPTVGIHQPGARGWLTELEAKAKRSNSAPILLSFSPSQYNCVIFDRHDPATKDPATKKLKTQHRNTMWNAATITTTKQPQTTATTPLDPTRTRRALISKPESITEDDLYSFLSAPEWATNEKMELIHIMITGTGNFKEMLTFSTTSHGTDTGDEVTRSPPAQQPDSDSSYEASQAPSSDMELVSPLEMKQLGKTTYAEDAHRMWKAVQDEWAAQHNELLPELMDQAGLSALIKRAPATLVAAGRSFGNTFAFLEHIPRKHIRDWMEPVWLDYCSDCLSIMIPAIKDTTVRTDLITWLHATRGKRFDVRRKLLKDQDRWDLVENHAPERFKGPKAFPFLGFTYWIISAYTLVLDLLIPELAGVLQEQTGPTEHRTPTSLVTAFKTHQEFRTAMKEGVKAKQWEPIDAFVRAQQHSAAAAAPRC